MIPEETPTLRVGPRSVVRDDVTGVLALGTGTPGYSAGDGPPHVEIPARAAPGIGAFETLLVLAGLVAAGWLLSRRS